MGTTEPGTEWNPPLPLLIGRRTAWPGNFPVVRGFSITITHPLSAAIPVYPRLNIVSRQAASVSRKNGPKPKWDFPARILRVRVAWTVLFTMKDMSMTFLQQAEGRDRKSPWSPALVA